MRKFLLILLGLSLPLFAKETICLNMIVKDETKVLCRCLASVKPLIDYWVIVDTGSTDGTQDMIRKFLSDIPGDLYERPWVDFAHNRNEALELAREQGDYILIIDADGELVFEEGFSLPPLNLDGYSIINRAHETHFPILQLISSTSAWNWEGVLHEYLACPSAQCATLEGVHTRVKYEGVRSQDPNKFLKDISVLEKALKEDPDNIRYQFYLAQSYRDANQPKEAIAAYTKRVLMEGWGEEVFWSLYQIGHQREKLGDSDVEESFLTAYQYRPTRAEPLYHLARLKRKNQNYLDAFYYAKIGLDLPYPSDILFLEHWVYEWGLLMEYSLAAYWLGIYSEAEKATRQLIEGETIPDYVKEQARANLHWIEEKLAS